MTGITLRQLINNHPLVGWINRSKCGRAFQESRDARIAEIVLWSLNDGIAESIADGKGIVEGLFSGLEKIYDLGQERKLSRYSGRLYQADVGVRTLRPDLNGQVDPRLYEVMLGEQRRGRDPLELIRTYKKVA